MKKIILFLGATLLLIATCCVNSSFNTTDSFLGQDAKAVVAHASTANKFSASSEVTVYICTGPKSKRYHRFSGCKGLKRCSDEIQAIPFSRAKALGRTPCKWCY